MITLEQAIRKARKSKSGYDIYSEYEDAYVFAQEKYLDNIGGEGSPVVILKSTGETMPYTAFLLTKPEGEEPIRLRVKI